MSASFKQSTLCHRWRITHTAWVYVCVICVASKRNKYIWMKYDVINEYVPFLLAILWVYIFLSMGGPPSEKTLTPHSVNQGCQIGPYFPAKSGNQCFPHLFYFTVYAWPAQRKILVLVGWLSCSFGIKSLSYFVTGNPLNLATLVLMPWSTGLAAQDLTDNTRTVMVISNINIFLCQSYIQYTALFWKSAILWFIIRRMDQVFWAYSTIVFKRVPTKCRKGVKCKVTRD